MDLFVVTMEWGSGYFAQVDLTASGPERAAKRAWLTALCPPLQWFDLDFEQVMFTVENEDTGEVTVLNEEVYFNA